MYIAYTVVAVLLSLVLLASARDKLVRNPARMAGFESIGVPLTWVPWLTTAEIAGAAGLLAGIWFASLGVAAAIGLVLYFVGAVGAHLRGGDAVHVAPAAVILIVSAVLIGLRIATV
ncbi:DoxX family protein [Nocardia sp. NPDC004260]